MLREETGRATSVAVGVDDLPQIRNKLRRTQAILYDDYDWSFLRQVFPLKTLQSGERYYDFPSGLNLERVEKVALWFSNVAMPITRGIESSDYSFLNPEAGVTSDPAMKWDVRWTGTKEQIEIWPVPASNDQSLQFIGLRALRPLVKMSDVADLDDELIVLTAAAELLARKDDKSASIIMKRAENRLHRLMGRTQGARKRYRLGMGSGEHTQPVTLVVHAR